MRTLTFPATIGDSIQILEDGVGTGTLSKAKIKALRKRYAIYAFRRGAGHAIKASGRFKGPAGTAIKAAYKKTHAGRSLEWLRTKLKAAAGNRCPSCGGSRPVELDHHLPQKEYPEYALFPLNLAACCGECNKAKSSHVATSPSEAFLHPYLDQVPATHFITATLAVDDGIYRATYGYDATKVADPVLAARIGSQLERVDFGRPLVMETEEVLVEVAQQIENAIEDEHGYANPASVRKYLIASAAGKERSHHVGFWQAVLLRALATDNSFCEGGYKAMATRKLP